jgi:riboflavin kinase/FMN adenylyltransferase
LREGKLEEARMLLGHNYAISGTVTHGQHLGTSLGFPTINQAFDEGDCPLAMGVYLTEAHVENAKFFGITNVGCRPTVNGKGVVAETNIFDFSDDLYGKQVRVEFIHFMRPERRFESIDALSAQVHEDIETAKKLANEYK